MATAYIPGPSLADAIASVARWTRLEYASSGGARRRAGGDPRLRDHSPGPQARQRHPGRRRPRIIDFGIAKDADASALTGSNAVIGTLRYMSPSNWTASE